MLILSINSGSSSLKCAAVDPDTGASHFSVSAERLGAAEARITYGPPTQLRTVEAPAADHEAALALALDALESMGDAWQELAGIGHRVVHGGEAFTESCWLDPAVERAIEDCCQLAPLHNPANLIGIRAARAVLPDLPQVAVFDTAFHQTLPPRAFRYAVPAVWYERHGIRRYGFHGTSHRYVAGRAAEVLGRPLAELQLITAHLGNGCSATAIAGGRSVDTTMGFTPLEGLVMGSRAGDLDPAIVFHLVGEVGMSLDEVERALTRESGLIGLSGVSNDFRTLQMKAIGNDSTASACRLAIDVFCHRLAKHLAALATNLGRLDAIVFTGGIGEHSELVRRRAAERLRGLGVTLDPEKNRAGSERIEANESHVSVLVIPTNEELMIARDTAMLLRAGGLA